MKPVASIAQSELDADTSARTWALIFHLADNPEVQRSAAFSSFWLAYIYDAEVKNGGHLQYFHNKGVSSVEETLDALRAIGATGHAELLETCWSKVKEAPVEQVSSLQEYSELAQERSFDDEDSSYYEQPRDVLDLLEAHFEALLKSAVSVSA
jgi:hypothetical protein